nr:hypothetical protein BaRGS_005740 [Batillaria attramentaria]
MMAKNDRLQSTDSNVEELPGRTVHQHSASDASGSTFIHWGRSTCPNNTEIVYPGVAGGIHYTLTGGPANRLCMTLEPEFDDVAVPTGRANLYGVEYQFPGHLNHDVPCSVCRAQQAVTVMYTGHLVAGHYDHKAASEYVCVDGQPEDRPSGEGNQKGAYFYLVRTVCGSLPCPPYVDMKVATCVVCSK